jgi:hypothetical protein
MRERRSVDEFIQAFISVEPRGDTVRKLDLLLDIERVDEPRVLAFLIRVLGDAGEPEPVRIDAQRRLSDAALSGDQRRRVGQAVSEVVAHEPGEGRLRLEAALALARFTDIGGAVDALRAVVLDESAPCELRYYAFTSLHSAGPTSEIVELLHRLMADEEFGRCAQGLLDEWGAKLPLEWRASQG